MKKRILIFGVIILIGLATLFASHYVLGRAAIPAEIESKLNFSPFITRNDLTIDESSVKYDSSQGGLSYTVDSKEFDKLTVSEQATPRQFIEIPDVYTKLVDGLNRYSVFQNQLGTIYLTKPSDQKSGQTAVMNSSGVLIFVRSQKYLSDDQWRKIFDAMSLDKK